MPANLFIQLFSNAQVQTNKQEIELYKAEKWTPETEEILLLQVHELISSIRHISSSLELSLKIEVTDIFTASFLINKVHRNENEIISHKLSVREIEVLGLIMQGYTTKEIAERLFISYETVKSHRKNILVKTGAKNTASLINYYHQTFFDK
ncbi:MAG TPA: helix-turn-helix transcriptional regulator [Ignavibacteriaceae bacterium]|nr:helix-turn-helix transcriptional regulator [Ignavibacteriaceae bacterium]